MDTPLLHSINDAATLLGIGRTTIYRLINEAHLDTRSIGRRTLITRDSIERFIANAAG